MCIMFQALGFAQIVDEKFAVVVLIFLFGI